MTKEEFIGKLRSIYVGEENAIDEIISEYDIQKRTIQYLSECINEKDGLIIEYRKEIDRLNNIIKDIKDYVNFLVIINQTINGKFSETQWGQDILGLIGDDNE